MIFPSLIPCSERIKIVDLAHFLHTQNASYQFCHPYSMWILILLRRSKLIRSALHRGQSVTSTDKRTSNHDDKPSRRMWVGLTIFRLQQGCRGICFPRLACSQGGVPRMFQKESVLLISQKEDTRASAGWTQTGYSRRPTKRSEQDDQVDCVPACEVQRFSPHLYRRIGPVAFLR